MKGDAGGKRGRREKKEIGNEGGWERWM